MTRELQRIIKQLDREFPGADPEVLEEIYLRIAEQKESRRKTVCGIVMFSGLGMSMVGFVLGMFLNPWWICLSGMGLLTMMTGGSMDDGEHYDG